VLPKSKSTSPVLFLTNHLHLDTLPLVQVPTRSSQFWLKDRTGIQQAEPPCPKYSHWCLSWAVDMGLSREEDRASR
jgi:hypothetical protein